MPLVYGLFQKVPKFKKKKTLKLETVHLHAFPSFPISPTPIA